MLHSFITARRFQQHHPQCYINACASQLGRHIPHITFDTTSCNAHGKAYASPSSATCATRSSTDMAARIQQHMFNVSKTCRDIRNKSSSVFHGIVACTPAPISHSVTSSCLRASVFQLCIIAGPSPALTLGILAFSIDVYRERSGHISHASPLQSWWGGGGVGMTDWVVLLQLIWGRFQRKGASSQTLPLSPSRCIVASSAPVLVNNLFGPRWCVDHSLRNIWPRCHPSVIASGFRHSYRTDLILAEWTLLCVKPQQGLCAVRVMLS